MFVTRGSKNSLFSVFDFLSNVNCKTPNVVYLLDCHVCGSQYVGESVQPFNKRMNGHRSHLTKKMLLPVSQHFMSPGHSLEDFGRPKIYMIDHNPSWKENQRQKKESFWIRELQTLHPEGIIKKA
jgi:predicted GIY-YIG superfamily endonuclease